MTLVVTESKEEKDQSKEEKDKEGQSKEEKSEEEELVLHASLAVVFH